MIKTIFFVVFAVFFTALCSDSAVANGLSIQSFSNDNGGNAQIMPVLGRTQPAPAQPLRPASNQMANLQNAMAPNDYGYKDQPREGTAPEEEYRGFNGRTLEQAFYRCKYETFRAAPPGERSKGFFERMKIRMYVMDVCMNSEGFFRTRSTFGFDKNLFTFGDIAN